MTIFACIVLGAALLGVFDAVYRIRMNDPIDFLKREYRIAERNDQYWLEIRTPLGNWKPHPCMFEPAWIEGKEEGPPVFHWHFRPMFSKPQYAMDLRDQIEGNVRRYLATFEDPIYHEEPSREYFKHYEETKDILSDLEKIDEDFEKSANTLAEKIAES